MVLQWQTQTVSAIKVILKVFYLNVILHEKEVLRISKLSKLAFKHAQLTNYA